MQEQDYYAILEVDRKSDASEIKKSYRKLAFKYHPDTNKDDLECEEKFKKINEAYAVLSDVDKRRQHDMVGMSNFRQTNSYDDLFRSAFNINEMFRDFNIRTGPSNTQSFSFSFFSSGPGQQTVNINTSPFGHYRHAGFNNVRTEIHNPSDLLSIEQEVYLTIKEIIIGTQKTITVNSGDIQETLSVRIPKGLVPGMKLKLLGKGNIDSSGNRGDLFIISRLIPDPNFSIIGLDIIVRKTIKSTDTSLEIINPLGIQLNVAIPPGMNSNDKLKLEKQGIPNISNPHEVGNILVFLIVEKETAEG